LSVKGFILTRQIEVIQGVIFVLFRIENGDSREAVDAIFQQIVTEQVKPEDPTAPEIKDLCHKLERKACRMLIMSGKREDGRGLKDLRDVLERASARETTMRVAAGAVALRLLEELGVPEAMWVFEARNFPAIVTMDSHGNSLHADVSAATGAELEKVGKV